MTTAHLEAEILKLPLVERAHLVERLISSLDEESDIEKAWDEEAERRYKAYSEGRLSARPVAEAMAEIRKQFESK